MKIMRLLIECSTPLHCGGREDEILDQPVVRDAFSLWRIPAASLAGSLRSLGMEFNRDLTEKMFGYQNEQISVPSLVWCEDGLLLDYDSIPALYKFINAKSPAINCEIFVRDHVCIDLETGASIEGGKYDMEIVPAGTRFLLCFRCDGWNRNLSTEEERYFDRLCARVLNGDLEIGGKTGLGYGQYKVLSSEYSNLNLQNPADMTRWLNWDYWALPNPDLSQAIPEFEKTSPGPNLEGWLEIPLISGGPILIGGGMAIDSQDRQPDILFALTPVLTYPNKEEKGKVDWKPVLPASSIRGVLRHAIYRIMRNLNVEKGKAEIILEDMFGTAGDKASKCGKIIVEDATLVTDSKNNLFKCVQHVALDRFSAAPIDGALFSEQPFWVPGAKTTLRLGTKNLEAYESALLFHALLDLFEGSLAIGSGVNRGNGRLTLAYWDEDKEKALRSIKWKLSFNGESVGENLNFFAEQWDKALWNKLSI